MDPHGQARGTPKTIPTYAKASVGHPPASEIRRSYQIKSLAELAFIVRHSSTVKAVVILRRRVRYFVIPSCEDP